MSYMSDKSRQVNIEYHKIIPIDIYKYLLDLTNINIYILKINNLSFNRDLKFIFL